MRRAYPQFLAAGGEGLPADILQIIFPLTYWDSIRATPTAHDLDPYRRRGADQPGVDVRRRRAFAGANAWGLMQIVPSHRPPAGAAAVGIRRFTTSMLTNGDINIRLGTLLFSRLVDRFGGDLLRARQLQRGRQSRRAVEEPSVRAWRKTSSSTTFRSPRRRIT